MLGEQRFATNEDNLRQWTTHHKAQELHLTIEAGHLTRWAASLLRPLATNFVICEPRYNKLISSSAKKSDEVDVASLCELLRLGALRKVWMGQDEDRATFRYAVNELIKFRDQQRELKTHIKSRYREVGILKLNGKELFHPKKRAHWIEQMPPARRHGLLLLYDLFDTAFGAWVEQLAEVKRLGKSYPEIERFMEVPGIGEIGAHFFSAMVEDPFRFKTAKELYRFCALGITSRSSDGKPLGYERIDRRNGRRELKTLAYHAWRTGIRAGKQSDVIRRFYFESKKRTGTARHGRLNTERKILKTLWSMWKNATHFDPKLFLQTPKPPTNGKRSRRRRSRRTRSRLG